MRSRQRQSFHGHWKNAPTSCVISPGVGPNGVWTETAFCWAATSVGGNLALTVPLLLRDTDGPPIKGILSSYPVCDSRLDTPSYEFFGAGGYGLTLEQMAFVWSHYVPHEIDRLHPLAAPLRADLKGLPPVLLVLPEMDILRSEGDAMAAKLAAAGVPVQTEVIQGMAHGFLRACGSVQKARDTLALIGEWLRGRAGA